VIAIRRLEDGEKQREGPYLVLPKRSLLANKAHDAVNRCIADRALVASMVERLDPNTKA